MKGHTRKRGSTWTIVFDEEHEDGKRRQRWISGFPTRKAAEEELRHLLRGIDTGTYVPPTKTTYSNFIRDTFLPSLEGRRRPTTIESYNRVFERHVLPRIGSTLIQHVNTTQIEKMYRELGEATPARPKPLQASTIRTIAAIVSSSFRYAEKKDLVLRNPCAKADLPAAVRKRRTTWSGRELRVFLDSVSDDPWYALWRLAVVTGMRRGELAGLTWLGLDFENSTVRVSQQIVRTKTGLVVAPPKSVSGEREIPIDERTLDALKEHRAAQELERAVYADIYEDSDLVFARPDGTPIHPSMLSMRFQALREASGLPRLRLHDLRHSYATMTLDPRVGTHPEIARRILGHARVETTTGIYMRGRADTAERAATAAAAALIDEDPEQHAR